MTPADLKSIITYLWNGDTHRYTLERKRVQLALFILLLGYTTSRPGALAESDTIGIRGTGAALLYNECEIMKLQIPESERGFVFAIRITLNLMKGRRDKNKP